MTTPLDPPARIQEKDHGGTGLTEVDAVSVSVHADQLSHVDPVQWSRDRLLAAVWQEGRCAPVSTLLDAFYEAVVNRFGYHGNQPLSDSGRVGTERSAKETPSHSADPPARLDEDTP